MVGENLGLSFFLFIFPFHEKKKQLMKKALQNWIGRVAYPIQRYLRVSITLQSFGV